jgi:hypothetical protein
MDCDLAQVDVDQTAEVRTSVSSTFVSRKYSVVEIADSILYPYTHE